MVWPSGAALATRLAPIVPPAPGRFSITKVCPTCLPTCSNTVRAMRSLATPAGTGTTTVTLRVGQSWADAWPKAASVIAAPRITRRAIFIVISSKRARRLREKDSVVNVASSRSHAGPSGLRSGPSSAFRTSSRAEAAFLLDKAGDLVDALAGAQIAEDEGTRAAHAPGIALHDGKRGADVRREVDLVDDEQIG